MFITLLAIFLALYSNLIYADEVFYSSLDFDFNYVLRVDSFETFYLANINNINSFGFYLII